MTGNQRVLVLGGGGMLGRVCVDVLGRSRALHVDATDRNAIDDEVRIDVTRDPLPLWSLLERRRYDVVINAIGILRDRILADPGGALREAIAVNALFPHDLAAHAALAGARVIHISTDAVFAGRHGAPYDEAAAPAPSDAYSASKWIGEPQSPSALTVRCSIIGRGRVETAGLLGWFRSLPAGATAGGFDDYRWTPATTVQVAQLLQRLLEPRVFDELRALSSLFHYAPNAPLSKWEMLRALNALRRDEIRLERVSHPGGPVNLSLATRFDAFRQLAAEPRPWPAVLSEVWL